MTTFKTFAFSFAIALGITAAGCAAQTPGTPGTDGTGSDMGTGSDNGGSDDVPLALDATGKYSMTSTYDIASNMPGTVGTVVNQFISATDDPDDPTHWILDQIIAGMGDGFLKDALSTAEPFVAGYLNDRLLDIAPDFVSTIVQVGNDFGDMAKHFGVNETLEVTGAGSAYTAVDTAVGVHFKVENVDMDFAFADYQLQNVVANNVGVTLDQTGKLTIAEHKMPLSYGKVLSIGLDEAIIPLIDPNASDLQTLLADHIDCAAVGAAIDEALASQIGIGGGAGTWESYCDAGLQYGAQFIYQKIDAIDGSALEFDETGTAKAVDKNHDAKVDTIQTGKWTGNMSYAGSPAPLASATFIGTRM